MPKKQALEHSSSKKIGYNAAWLIAEKVFQVIQGIFVNAMVARYLQPEQYGTLAFSLSIIGMLGMFARFGMEQAVVQNVASRTLNPSTILNKACRISTILGLLCLLIVVSISHWIQDKTLSSVLIILSFSLIDQIGTIYRLGFQAFLESRLLIPVYISVSLAFAIVQLLLVIFRFPIYGFAVSFVLSQYTSSFVTFFFYQRDLKRRMDLSLPNLSYKILLKQSFPLFLNSIIGFLYTNLDRIMLGSLSSLDEVGMYAVASKIFESLFFIPTVLIVSLSPRLALEAGGHKKVNDYTFLTAGSTLAFIALITMFLTIGIGPFTISLLYGSKFNQSAYVLIVLSLCLLPLSIGRLRNASWVAQGDEMKVLYTSILGLTVNASLNFLLIDKFGSVGAALGTFLAFMTAFWLGGYMISSTREIANLQTRAILSVFSKRFLDSSLLRVYSFLNLRLKS
jgi:O-antigen/teichoic acid export membrane protein